MPIRSLALAALVVVAGCHWDLNDKGTDPPTGQLYFPAGIAMDPGGQYLYVSNGNADLRWGGGTVQMIDALAFECVVAHYRAAHPLGCPPPGSSLPEPDECTQDRATPIPAACAGYEPLPGGISWDQWATQSYCQRDPSDPSIIDCDETAFILQNSTVKIGNFAGTIRLVPDANDAQHRTLFVAVRGDPSITRIDVRLPGAQGALAQSPSDPGLLVCFNKTEAALQQRSGYNPAQQLSTTPIPCDASYLVQDFACSGLPSCQNTNLDQNNKTQLPTEPFAMALDLLRRRLLVSHLVTGQISVIDVDAAPAQALLSESEQFFNPDASGRHGAFGLAKQHPDDPFSNWYVTSATQAAVATFKLGASDLVLPQTQFGINATFAQGNDVRDIRFDVGGNRAFITENNPPSVLVMDTRTAGNTGGQPTNTVTDVIDVCQTPSHTGLRRMIVQNADGTTSYKNKLVVVCFLSTQVMIVDPDRPGVDDTVFSGFAGPNDVAFNFPNADDPTAVTQLAPRHAYITNYSDSTIAVVDLEPNSPTENRVLARLGMPTGGFNP